MAGAVHACESVKCNDRASRRFMMVHVNAHRPAQRSPQTQLLVITAILALLAMATTSSGQNAPQTERAVGATVRRVVSPRPYNWRGAATRALVTTIWYPAASGTVMAERVVGPQESPLFRLGSWTDDSVRAEGRFPLILLSHGTGGSAQIMAWVARGLASAGFIVAAVNHPGNNALEPYTAEGFLVWWERAKDLSTVLDFMLRDADFAGAVDRRRIGAIGYSLGGYTMFEIAGARTDPALLRQFCASSPAEGCDDPPEFPDLFARWNELEATNNQFQAEVKEARRSYRDNRVRAVFAIAPALGPALIPSTVQRISIPVEIVAGQNDQIAPVAFNAQTLARLSPKARLTLLPGAGHYTFLATCTDRGRREQPQLCIDASGVDREAVHARTLDLAVAFFRTSLGTD